MQHHTRGSGMARLFLYPEEETCKTDRDKLGFLHVHCTHLHTEPSTLRRESISRKTSRVKMTLFPANWSECVLPPGSMAFLCQLKRACVFLSPIPRFFPFVTFNGKMCGQFPLCLCCFRQIKGLAKKWLVSYFIQKTHTCIYLYVYVN